MIDVEAHPARGLNRIGVQQRPLLVRDRRDFAKLREHPDLVVRRHHAHRDGVRCDSRPKPIEIDEAIGLLGEHGDDAKLLAGGHSLLPLMKLRLATPGVLVDIGRIGDLNFVRSEGGEVRIVCNQPRVRKVFEITRLDSAFDLCSSVEDAAKGDTRE